MKIIHINILYNMFLSDAICYFKKTNICYANTKRKNNIVKKTNTRRQI